MTLVLKAVNAKITVTVCLVMRRDYLHIHIRISTSIITIVSANMGTYTGNKRKRGTKIGYDETRQDKTGRGTRQEKFTQMAQDTTSQDSISHKTKSSQNKTTTATTITPSHKTRRDKPRHDKTNPERAKTRQRPPSFPLPLLLIHSFYFTLFYL